MTSYYNKPRLQHVTTKTRSIKPLNLYKNGGTSKSNQATLADIITGGHSKSMSQDKEPTHSTMNINLEAKSSQMKNQELAIQQEFQDVSDSINYISPIS